MKKNVSTIITSALASWRMKITFPLHSRASLRLRAANDGFDSGSLSAAIFILHTPRRSRGRGGQSREQQRRSCEELISMLITFKVIILYITQVIISMQTSVKMGRAWFGLAVHRGGSRGWLWPYHRLEGSSEHAKNKIEKFTTCRDGGERSDPKPRWKESREQHKKCH